MTGLFNHPKRKLKKFIHDGEYEQAIEHAKSMEDKYSDDPDSVSYTHLTLPTKA